LSLLLPKDVTFSEATPPARLALSPDGTRLAFAATGSDGVNRLYVRALDTLTAQPLTGTEGALAPFWSPDNRFIGYFSVGGAIGTGTTLKKITASGGPPSKLCDVPGGIAGATWSTDNVILFASAASLRGLEGGIRRVSGSGGPCSLVVAPDATKGEAESWLPFFLPDQKHFLYLALNSGLRPIGIYAASLGSSERKLLVSGGSNAQYTQGYLMFLRDQTLMAQSFNVERLELIGDPVPIAEEIDIAGQSGVTGAFSLSNTGILAYQIGPAGGRSRLTWFDRTGKELGPIGDEGNYGALALSRNGTHASVSMLDPERRTRDVWLVDLVRGLRTRFTFDPSNEEDSIWSPDGSRLVFNSNRKGPVDLYVKASKGAGAEELLFADDADKLPVSWSSDGRYVLYMRHDKETGFDLWALPMVGDRKPLPVAQTRFDEGPGDFSPDGHWIAFASTESGRAEVYAAPFPGPGGKVLVSSAGVDRTPFRAAPRWRQDGQEIVYVAPDGLLMAASVHRGGDTIEVGDVRPLFRLPALPHFTRRAFYGVTSDGQRFLINGVGEQGPPSPITLVVNWPALLKK
jgi:Tol biopolymer transport system component